MKKNYVPEIHIFAKHGQLFTTSIDVAEKFEKQHKDVLKAVRELDCSPEFNQRNFALVEYFDEKGERRPMYHISRDGFTFLAMGFRGKKVAPWKEKYIQTFNLMEQSLLNQKNLSWQASRQQGKLSRLEETDTIKDFIAYAAAQGSSKPNWYYKHITNATYKALFLITDKFPGSFRNMLDNAQLSFLATAEHVAAKALRDGMAQNLFYKDIFILAKGRLESLGKNVGVSRVVTHNPQMLITARA